MERPPSEHTDTQAAQQPGEPQASPLTPQFSDHDPHEPPQARYRDEWPESTPPIYPFIEQRYGDRRHRTKPVTVDRRHPEAGDRRQLPLMRPLPGFHIDGEPQHDYQESVLMGAIPSIRDRIFTDQHYQPDIAAADSGQEQLEDEIQ